MHFADLTKRLITSLIALIILVGCFMFAHLGVVKWLILLFAIGITSLGIWELSQLSDLNEKKGVSLSCIGIGSLTVVAYFFSTLTLRWSYLPFGAIFFGVTFLLIYHFNKIEGSIISLSKSLFSICYVSIPIGLILKILYFQGSHGSREGGSWWFMYLLIVTKVTDIGAYFGGRLLGKKKLAPHLSPSKTVSGAVVGFISALVFSYFFYLVSPFFDDFYLTFAQSIYLGVVVGVMGQIGDLGESVLKRDAGVKDSNRLPGLGGGLDMLDSLLLTAPALYLFLCMHHAGWQ